jgi:hypothetical protein
MMEQLFRTLGSGWHLAAVSARATYSEKQEGLSKSVFDAMLFRALTMQDK